MAEKEYYKGNIGKFLGYIAGNFNIDLEYMRACMYSNFPELKNKECCPNCGANMKMDVHTASLHVSLLLIAMAKEIKHKNLKGIPFTEANKIHTPTLAATDATRHVTSISAYLGLIVQPKEWSGSGHWLITNWGWKVLRGEPVSKKAMVFRGEIIERSLEQITLAEMFKSHVEQVERALARRKAIEQDFRADAREYNPIEWVEFGGYAEGALF